MATKSRLYTCYHYQYAESRHALVGCYQGDNKESVPGEAISEPLVIEANNKPEAIRKFRLQAATQM